MNTRVYTIRELLDEAMDRLESNFDKKAYTEALIDSCIEKDLMPECLEAITQLLVLYKSRLDMTERQLEIAESVLMEDDQRDY